VCGVLILIIYITPFLITHFSYYIPAKQWNSNVIVTNGQVTTQNIHEYITKYSCNCVKTCSGAGSRHHCTTKCDTCTRPCYSGEIIVGYDTGDENETSESMYIAKMTPYNCYYNLQKMENEMQSVYPIGRNITIYYDKNNPDQYRFEITPTYRTAEVCSICIPLGIIILNIIFMIIMIICKKYNQNKVSYQCDMEVV
jgi:hypothetical protein